MNSLRLWSWRWQPSWWIAAMLALSTGGLAQPFELSRAGSELFTEYLVPVRTTDPDAPTADLSFLDDFVAGARVVALGEPTHGAHEIFELKHRVIRYLVEVHGFTAVAMEANLPESRAVDDFINGSAGSAPAALGGLFTVWITREVLELVEWLGQYNETAAEPVSFHGVDIQSPWSAAKEVLDFLEWADPEYYATAQEFYAPALALVRDWSPAGLARVAPTLLRNAELVLEHLAVLHVANEALESDDLDWAITNASLIVQLAQSHYDNLPSRDQSMADNLLRLLEGDPDLRIILWAHNAHILEAEPERFRDPRMGAHLERVVGDSYRTIGFVFAQGQSRAIDPDTGRWVSHEFPLAPRTVGGELHGLGVPMFFLEIDDLKIEEENAAWFAKRQPFRWAGASAVANFHYLIPAEAFDALLFVDTISRAQDLPR